MPNIDDPSEIDLSVDPLDRLLETEPAVVPVAPDGGFAPTIVDYPEPIPEATVQTMVCLRNCRHYFETAVPFAAGNPKGTFKKLPVQTTRYCTVTASPIDLTDENVFDCTRWDPLEPDVLAATLKRREDWYAANPDVTRPVKEGN